MQSQGTAEKVPGLSGGPRSKAPNGKGEPDQFQDHFGPTGGTENLSNPERFWRPQKAPSGVQRLISSTHMAKITL